MPKPENVLPTTWLRGLLDVAILAVLADRETHGYAISQALQEQGFGRITGGGLYPVLGRLEDEGFVVAQWTEGDGGPGRKMYEITSTGRSFLIASKELWVQFRSAIDLLLELDD